ncbi:MAG: histidinol-phosphate transaminase [Mariprofundaceae bacterium]|nr:histidinol-phosphate transaminase [Mariprofundaceae bacterium]
MNTDHIDWMTQSVNQAQKLHPYVPGKPVQQLLREQGLDELQIEQQVSQTIKLASNENPYGVPPQAVQAMQDAASEVHRYPDGDCFALKQALASEHGVETSQLLVGNGSNEVLELIIRCFAGVGDEVVYSQRGFIVYALATTAAGATAVAVPEADGLTHDLKAMAAAVQANTKVICLANPNNPTGSLLATDALQTFLDGLPRHVVVILDEAYYEYVQDDISDSIHALNHPGLIVSRTFSKAYGLAGCRVGYAVADSDLLAVVNRFREPFNVNSLAQAGAVGALRDKEWLLEKVAACKKERLRLEDGLLERGCFMAKSYANFVLLQHEKSLDICQRLEDKGVIVRPLAPYGMADVLRVSVGNFDENTAFLSALDDVLAELP